MADPQVVVIGGGPGGSTAATALARKGYRVLLLEREHFPREHIGESLLPASMPFLEWLGVLPAVQEAGFLKKWGATMLWGKSPEPWSWYFRETNTSQPHAYQVWRAQFDQILLDNARANGVDVREGHRVTSVTFDGPKASGVRFVDDHGRVGEQKAAWIVDASGQGAVIGHARNLRKWDTFFQNMAVYAYFQGADTLPSPDETNIFIESYTGGWFWNIPLHNGWMSTGAVVDSEVGRQGLRRLGMEGFLRDQIAMTAGTRHMLRNASLVRGPATLKDWSYLSDEVVGDGYILVGDAACFIDPLFSSGVHLAMTSGAMAAAYVSTVLKDESMRGPGAIFYKEQYYAEYTQFREMAKLFYSTNRTIDSYFWEARRILPAQDWEGATPRQAFIRAVAGRPPKGYERVVIERGEAPSGFANEVLAEESETNERRAAFEAWSSPQRRGEFQALRPRLAGHARVQKQPQIEDGEFVWGYALSRHGEMLGSPLDPISARIAVLSDGSRSVADIARSLSEGALLEAGQIDQLVTAALGRLFKSGDITLEPASDQ